MEYVELKLRLPKLKVSWFRFSLRTVFVLVLGIAVGAAMSTSLRPIGTTSSRPIGTKSKTLPPLQTASWNTLGFTFQPSGPEDSTALRNSQYEGALRIVEVREHGPAAAQDIRDGDILVGIHTWPTTKPENIAYVLQRIYRHQLPSAKFYILRGEETFYGNLSFYSTADMAWR